MRDPAVSRVPRPIGVDPVLEPARPAYAQAPDARLRMSLRRGGRLGVAGGGGTTLLDTHGVAERVRDARAAAHEVALCALRALAEAGRSS